MQQPGLTPLGGPPMRNSTGTADLQYDAQENTPLVGAVKQQDQQQQYQLHSSSYLWQQFRPAPPTMQQRQQDEVRHLDLAHPVCQDCLLRLLWAHMLPVRVLHSILPALLVAMRPLCLLLVLLMLSSVCVCRSLSTSSCR